jgi:hypothetical protein
VFASFWSPAPAPAGSPSQLLATLTNAIDANSANLQRCNIGTQHTKLPCARQPAWHEPTLQKQSKARSSQI